MLRFDDQRSGDLQMATPLPTGKQIAWIALGALVVGVPLFLLNVEATMIGRLLIMFGALVGAVPYMMAISKAKQDNGPGST